MHLGVRLRRVSQILVDSVQRSQRRFVVARLCLLAHPRKVFLSLRDVLPNAVRSLLRHFRIDLLCRRGADVISIRLRVVAALRIERPADLL